MSHTAISYWTLVLGVQETILHPYISVICAPSDLKVGRLDASSNCTVGLLSKAFKHFDQYFKVKICLNMERLLFYKWDIF